MYTSDVRDNVNLLEYGKFVRLDNDSRFPAISVIRTAPNSTDLNPITALDVYPKYALITYTANSDEVTSWDVLSGSIPQNTPTQLTSNASNKITITNDTGYTLYIKKTSGTVYFPLLNNTSVQLNLVSNTNEITIKQTGSSGALTVYGLYIKR